MKSAGVVMSGNVKERLKSILSNLEPKNKVDNCVFAPLRRPSAHQALQIPHDYVDLHQGMSSSETPFSRDHQSNGSHHS